MRCWLTKSSYIGEYAIWLTEPTPYYNKDVTQVFYTNGEVLARGLYSFEKMFPKIAIQSTAGKKPIQIIELNKGDVVTVTGTSYLIGELK